MGILKLSQEPAHIGLGFPRPGCSLRSPRYSTWVGWPSTVRTAVSTSHLPLPTFAHLGGDLPSPIPLRDSPAPCNLLQNSNMPGVRPLLLSTPPQPGPQRGCPCLVLRPLVSIYEGTERQAQVTPLSRTGAHVYHPAGGTGSSRAVSGAEARTQGNLRLEVQGPCTRHADREMPACLTELGGSRPHLPPARVNFLLSAEEVHAGIGSQCLCLPCQLC